MDSKNTLVRQLPIAYDLSPKKIAIKYKSKKDAKWSSIIWKNYISEIIKLHYTFKTNDLSKHSKIGIFSNSRYEWALVDWAALSCELITIPIYPNISSEDLEYIINDGKIKYLFIESYSLLKQWMMIKQRCQTVQKVIVFDFDETDQIDSQVISFNQFYKQQNSNLEIITTDIFSNFKLNCDNVSPDSVATIIYTSGTTGRPKPISLTHHNVYSSSLNALNTLNVKSDDITLSVLPYSHVLGRTEHFGHILFNYTLVFSQSLDKIRQELKEVEPTILVGVPRIFEKIYTSIKLKSETNFFQRTAFNRATDISSQLSHIQQTDNLASIGLILKYFIAKPLVLDRIKHEVFGSRFRFAITGGATLNKDIAEFFHGIGILVLEGYGLTETSGPITVNTKFDYQFGTVGKPISGANIKINSDGEILVSGDSVMNNNSTNNYQFLDSWLKTGDIGYINNKGNLVITDRKRDLIKTANGKFIAPQKLESLVKQIKYISQCHIHGEQKKYIVALCTLNKSLIIQFAQENNISFTSIADLREKSQVQELIRKGIANINHQLASHETIKNFYLLPNEFTIEDGELTPSMKLKRKVIDEKYKNIIDSLY